MLLIHIYTKESRTHVIRRYFLKGCVPGIWSPLGEVTAPPPFLLALGRHPPLGLMTSFPSTVNLTEAMLTWMPGANDINHGNCDYNAHDNGDVNGNDIRMHCDIDKDTDSNANNNNNVNCKEIPARRRTAITPPSPGPKGTLPASRRFPALQDDLAFGCRRFFFSNKHDYECFFMLFDLPFLILLLHLPSLLLVLVYFFFSLFDFTLFLLLQCVFFFSLFKL